MSAPDIANVRSVAKFERRCGRDETARLFEWLADELELARDAMKALVSHAKTQAAEGLVDGDAGLEPVRKYLRHHPHEF